MSRSYHHGNLRNVLLDAAVEVIAERGVAGTSLREVARRAEVTHTAAAYHFGDKAGLMLAVAVEGFERLGQALATAHQERRNFLEVGVSYVHFAVTNPAHFEVMFQPMLYDEEAPLLRAAKRRTAEVLYGTAEPDRQQMAAGVAAWSIVHGLASLWLNGNIPPQLGSDPDEVARVVAAQLGRRPRRSMP